MVAGKKMRAFAKNIARAITGNLARFLAIFGVVAVGAGVFAGLRAFVPDMYISADAFYDEQNFADLQVVSALGLTDDDVAALREVPGIEGATGISSYETVMADAGGELLQVQIEALPLAEYAAVRAGASPVGGEQGSASTRPSDVISDLIVRQGRLPAAPGEIAVSSNGHLKPESVQIGDRLEARQVMGLGDAAGTYACTEFTVVGIVTSPEWLSVSTGLSPTSGARVTNYAYIDRSSLVDPALYTAAIATVEGARDLASFSQEYDECIADAQRRVKAIAGPREDERYDELAAQALDALSAAESFADQSTKIDAALAMLPNPVDVRELLGEEGDDSEPAEKPQGAALRLLPLTGPAPLGSGARQELLAALDTFAAGKTITASREGISIGGEAPVGAVDLAETMLDRAREAQGRIAPAKWYVLTRDANPSYYVYKATALRMDRICLIFPVFFFLVSGLVSLTTMGRMVASERVEIGTLSALGYRRSAIAAKYVVLSGVASTTGAIAGVLVGSWLLPIAIWIPYSTMYAEIAFYTGLRMPGCLLAIAISVALALGAALVAVSRVLKASTASLLLPASPKSGRRIVLERIRPLWNKLGFSQKVTARNVFRYKARMAMTVVGVMGCCGLMLCGFGVQNKLDGFVEAQYGGIYGFDVLAVFDGDRDPEAADGSPGAPLARGFDDALGDDRWTYLMKRACVVANPLGDPAQIPYGIGGRLDKTGGSVQAELRDARSDRVRDDRAGILRDAAVYVFPDGSDQEFIEINDLHTGKRLALPGQGRGIADDSARSTESLAGDELPGTDAFVTSNDGRVLPGAVITQRLAEELLVCEGDVVEVSFDDNDGACAICVSGIMRNLVGHFVYMSPAAYSEAFGGYPDAEICYNLVLGFAPEGIDTIPGSADATTLKNQVRSASPAVTAVMLALEESDGYENIATTLNSIVVILLAVSCLLAFIVVYALTEINIEERYREIATLEVLGFTPAEVRGYVYRETYVLTAIGIVCGLPFGAWLCDFVMRSAEFDNVIYFRTVDPWCYVAAVLLTAAVVALVTAAMRKRLARIEMVSSLKSVD